MKRKDDINLHALFIGDKSENGELYKDMLINLVDEHLGWRQNYMPQDKPVISSHEKNVKFLLTIKIDLWIMSEYYKIKLLKI